MSVKLEKVVEKFYEGLEEGKFLGRKCTECGAVEFPPVYACNTCGCMDMEWVEIDRIGELNLWEGDRIFLRLLVERESFFSLKLVYDGHDRLVSAALDGRPMEL